MHSRQHQYNKSQWKKDYRRQYQEILTITMFVSTELREMKTQRPHCTYTLMQWLATFQQSLSGPAWQTLAEEMCSCCTALLAACFPIIPGWWESCTSCGGGCMTKTSVRGRSWPLRLLLYQRVQPPPKRSTHAAHKEHKALQSPSACTGRDLSLSRRVWQTAVTASSSSTSLRGLKRHLE